MGCDEIAHKSHCHYRDGFPLRGLFIQGREAKLGRATWLQGDR